MICEVVDNIKGSCHELEAVVTKKVTDKYTVKTAEDINGTYDREVSVYDKN